MLDFLDKKKAKNCENVMHYCAADAAFRATQLKVAITRWLNLHQKEGLCQEENITARI